MSQIYPLTDTRTGKTYQMPWDGPEPPSQDDARKYIFSQETKGPISRGLDDVEGFLGEHKQGIDNFLFGPKSVPNPTDIGPKNLAISSESEPLAPAMSGATSTFGKLGQGAYNYLLRPLTSPSGFLGAGSLHDMPLEDLSSAEEEAGSSGAARPKPRPNRPRPPVMAKELPGDVELPPQDPNVPIDADFREVGSGQLGTTPEPKALPPLNDRGLPAARPTYFGGSSGISTDIDAANKPLRKFAGGPPIQDMGPLPVSNRNAMLARLADLTKRKVGQGLEEITEPPVFTPPKQNVDILEQNNPYGIFQSSNIPDIEDTTPPPSPKQTPPLKKTKFEQEPEVIREARPAQRSGDKELSGMFKRMTTEDLAKYAKTKADLPQEFYDEADSRPDFEQVMDKLYPKNTALPNEPNPESPRPYQNATDDDLKFLMTLGDKAAESEAQYRPKLKDFLKSFFSDETGAIGDVKGARAASAGARAKSKTLQDIEDEINKRIFEVSGEEPTYNNKRNLFSRSFNPAKGTPYEIPFRDWVSKLKSGKIKGIIAARNFSDLADQGLDPIHALESGDRTGRLQDIADYLDSLHEQMQQAGVPVNYEENYFPHVWDNPAVAKNVYRRLGLKPSITMNRTFHTMQEAMDYAAEHDIDLKPKFDNVPDFLKWYTERANKAIADREFYNYGRENKFFRVKGKGGPNWQDLDPNHFPSIKINKASGTETLPFTAPPKLAELINNFLGEPEKLVKWIGDKASISKNFALSAGAPGTGLNAHGWNILARTIHNFPTDTPSVLKYLIRPSTAERDFNSAIETAPWAVEHGLELTTEGHQMGTVGSTHLAGRVLQKALAFQGKWFEDPLFQKVIPAIKLKHFYQVTEDLAKQGMSRDEAGRAAADLVNQAFGGINWEAMGRSRNLQNLARATVLAPDWLEGNIRTGTGLAKTIADAIRGKVGPTGKFYAKMMRNIVGSYVAANVVNYMTSGHPMWENPDGHSMDIYLGKHQQEDRWLRPFGTAADFVRLPLDTAVAALKHDSSGKYTPDYGEAAKILKYRLSVPGSVGVDLLSNQNTFGRPLFGKDDYGNPIPALTQLGHGANELSRLISPPYTQAVTNFLSGNVSPEQALFGATESPIRYSATPKIKHHSHSFGSRSRRPTRP